MERDAYQRLVTWKQQTAHKPLIVTGPRQVGKTWLMEEFGRQHYDSVVKLSFNEDASLERLLFPDRRAHSIIRRLEIYREQEINPATTLLILDEIQDAPQALGSLKSFAETAPEYQIIAAGSLLGLALHHDSSFPVGKVSFVDLHPMSFSEFLRATGRRRLDDLLASDDNAAITGFADQLVAALKTYHLVGGMPEVVAEYAATSSLSRAQGIQDDILRALDLDVSKHAPSDLVPRIRRVLASIPAQLAREKKRFTWGHIEPGARARSYEQALDWLINAGLVTRVARVSAPRAPLKAYEDEAFRLFFADIGLLARSAGLAASTVLEGSTVFTEFKGALAEQFVLQEFVASQPASPHYWSNERSTAEVDFLIDVDNHILPVEVKAERNRQAKSLQAYIERFSPAVAVRLSLATPGDHGPIVDLPLYAAGRVADIAQRRLAQTDSSRG